MPSTYQIARARGGKHDKAVSTSVKGKLSALLRGQAVSVNLDEDAAWEGTDSVDIRDDHVVFLERNDHTFSPVAIKAVVRVLHANGVRGRYELVAAGDTVRIRQV
jgi:hypothetical protein